MEGPREVMASLYAEIRPRPGEAFRRQQAQASTQRLRDALVRLGYWKAGVTVAEAYDPTAAVMSLVFAVEPGPLLDVEVHGEGAGHLRGRIRDLLKEGGVKLDTLEEASDLLEEDARRRGHRVAQVTRHEEQRGPRSWSCTRWSRGRWRAWAPCASRATTRKGSSGSSSSARESPSSTRRSRRRRARSPGPSRSAAIPPLVWRRRCRTAAATCRWSSAPMPARARTCPRWRW